MSAQDEIVAVLKRYETALNTGDPALAVSCYTSDGLLMPQGSPTAAAAQLLPTYERIFQATAYDIRFAIDEVEILGEDVAYALTRSTGTLTTLADGTRRGGANREMFIFRRAGGQWRIARYLFNNDALTAGAPA